MTAEATWIKIIGTAGVAPDWECLDRCRAVAAAVLHSFQPEQQTPDDRLADEDASILSGRLIDAIRDAGALAGGARSYDEYVRATQAGWDDTRGVKEIDVRAAFIIVQWEATELLKLPSASRTFKLQAVGS